MSVYKNDICSDKRVKYSLAFQSNSFDILRIIAALSIVSTHLLAHMPPSSEKARAIMSYFNSYFYGVVIFFTISGFLIPKSIENSSSFISFIKGRLIRLYPGIWCQFAISFIVIMILYHPSLTLKRILVWFGTQLTFFQVYTPSWLRGYGNGTPNGALWTIIVELQLYIITWLLYKKFKELTNLQWGYLILLAIVTNLICWIIEDRIPHIIYRLIFVSFIPHFYIYCIGVFLFFKRDTILLWLSKRWISVLIAYTINMSVFYFYVPRIGFYAPIHIGLTLPVMIISVAYGLGMHRLKYEITYGIYLYHLIAINALIQLGVTDGTKGAIIVTLISVLLGFLQDRFIDKPLSRIRHDCKGS